MLDIGFDPKNNLIYRLHDQIQNGKLIGNRKLTIIDLEGNAIEHGLAEESGIRMLVNKGKLYLIQRDIPNENSIRINEYQVILPKIH